MPGTSAASSTDAGGIEQIVDAVRRMTPSCGESIVVAVDGPSCAGKSTFANRLGETLGATVVHMDDMYPGWNGLSDATHGVVDRVLVPISAHQPGRHRRWDWEEERWHDGWVEVPPAEIVIVEGVGSASKYAAPHLALTVWLEAPASERFTRAMARDERFRPYWEDWAEQEARYFRRHSPKQRADIVIDTSSRH